MNYTLGDKTVVLEDGFKYLFNEHMRLSTVRQKPMVFGGTYGQKLAFKPGCWIEDRLWHRKISGSAFYWFTATELEPCLVPYDSGSTGLTKFFVDQGLEEGADDGMWTLPDYVFPNPRALNPIAAPMPRPVAWATLTGTSANTVVHDDVGVTESGG